MYLCSSCKISQYIYIVCSDTEIQSKNGDLKFGNKHWNFTQMAIPVTAFHVYVYVMHKNSLQKLYSIMYIVFCITLAAYGCTTVGNEILVQIYGGLGDAAKDNVK